MKCSYRALEFGVQIRSYFWSAFSNIWTEYKDLRSKFSPNTENTDQKKTPYLDAFYAGCLLMTRQHQNETQTETAGKFKLHEKKI